MFRISLIALAFSLAACSFSRDGGYSRQFTLESARISAGAYRKTSQTLKVELPTVAPELDTDRIALVQFDGRQDYIANAKWADFLPVIIQSSLVQSFAASGRYANVMADDTPAPARYELVTRVEQFEIRMTSGVAPAMARIKMHFKLMPSGGGRVLAEAEVERSQPIAVFQLTRMMDGLSRLFEEVQTTAVAQMGPR